MTRFTTVLFTLAIQAMLTGCAHSTIVPFSKPPTGGFAPKDPNQVGIYRSEKPLTSFEEIGLISYQVPNMDLRKLYDRIRTDAADYGADDVVDVRLKGESHFENRLVTECLPVTSSGSNGQCTTTNVCNDHYQVVNVTNFLVEGSMIRRKP